MSKVGIIANPASGKDIRRLVSYATVISNAEKTDVIRRVILGLDSTGVEEVWIMPDFYGLGLRAMEALSHHSLKVQVSIMDMVIEGTQEDSVRAARIMEEAKMDCIVTLGGGWNESGGQQGLRPSPADPHLDGHEQCFSGHE